MVYYKENYTLISKVIAFCHVFMLTAASRYSRSPNHQGGNVLAIFTKTEAVYA